MLLSLNENTSSMTKTRLVEHDITFEKDNHRENLKITASHCSAACDPARSEIIRLAASYLLVEVSEPTIGGPSRRGRGVLFIGI